jgi:hypothetical protein
MIRSSLYKFNNLLSNNYSLVTISRIRLEEKEESLLADTDNSALTETQKPNERNRPAKPSIGVKFERLTQFNRVGSFTPSTVRERDSKTGRLYFPIFIDCVNVNPVGSTGSVLRNYWTKLSELLVVIDQLDRGNADVIPLLDKDLLRRYFRGVAEAVSCAVACSQIIGLDKDYQSGVFHGQPELEDAVKYIIDSLAPGGFNFRAAFASLKSELSYYFLPPTIVDEIEIVYNRKKVDTYGPGVLTLYNLIIPDSGILYRRLDVVDVDINTMFDSNPRFNGHFPFNDFVFVDNVQSRRYKLVNWMKNYSVLLKKAAEDGGEYDRFHRVMTKYFNKWSLYNSKFIRNDVTSKVIPYIKPFVFSDINSCRPDLDKPIIDNNLKVGKLCEADNDVELTPLFIFATYGGVRDHPVYLSDLTYICNDTLGVREINTNRLHDQWIGSHDDRKNEMENSYHGNSKYSHFGYKIKRVSNTVGDKINIEKDFYKSRANIIEPGFLIRQNHDYGMHITLCINKNHDYSALNAMIWKGSYFEKYLEAVKLYVCGFIYENRNPSDYKSGPSNNSFPVNETNVKDSDKYSLSVKYRSPCELENMLINVDKHIVDLKEWWIKIWWNAELSRSRNLKSTISVQITKQPKL